MANIITETVAVTAPEPGLLEIAHSQVHSDGIDMGGTLVLERSAAAWLAGEVDRAADAFGFAEVDHALGADHFTIYVGGSEMQPFVHVHNQRAATAPRGKVYTLAMSVDVARTLAAQLRAHAAP